MKAPPGIALRRCGDADLGLLYRIYASTRTEELAPLDWDEAQKQAFLRMQFDAQHAHYLQHFPEAAFDVVEQGGAPVGRLYVDRRDDEIRIVDIALLPEHRKRGIGRGLLEALLEEATDSGKPVRIHVEMQNPALNLYRRLGFSDVAENGVYLLMEWRASQPKASS